MLDVLIKGGTVVDGTGADSRQADVGIRDGRIVAIGDVAEEAAEVVDATGMVVCPGFVDPHTHYDAQIFWDPRVTPSNLFGVTSIMAGNCGFSLAPIGDDTDAEYLAKMMVRVEGMALEALDQGVPFNWNSFGEYLDRLDDQGTAVNVGFLVGHCALRRVVMKDDAVGSEATPDQIDQMRALLKESIEAGGVGFSTGRSFTHSDWDGQPVPSRWAAWEEVLELCREVGQHEGTTLEWVADGCLNGFNDDEVELMTKMSLEGRRPINWNVLTVDSARTEAYENQLEACEKANEGLKGRRAEDIARERGTRTFHTIVDICLEDDLRTVLWPGATDDDPESWRLRAKVWDHPDVMIGGSDAGAHLDRMAGAPYPAAWIGDCLRGRKLTTMENAVRHMTDVPARLFGLRDRGRVEEGFHADLVLFDPEEIDATEPELVFDLPGDSKRLWAEAVGIRRVLVNGVTTVIDGEATDALPGRVMRSGTDTETVAI